MSKINPKQAYTKEILDRFEGVGEALAAEKAKTSSIVNFRILADGSLEKRNGWKSYLRLANKEICGVWQGNLEGDPLFIIVTKEAVYCVENEVASFVSSLPYKLSGQVSLFSYCNHLYMINGNSILVWRKNLERFEEATGYVPLLGIGWHPRTMGASHEALNLLSNRARVHYTNTSGETVFHLPLIANKINAVIVDGKTTNNYVFSNPTNDLVVNAVGSSVEIAFEFDAPCRHLDTIHHSTLFFTDYFGEREKLLLSGSEKGQLVYSAREVTNLMLVSCGITYPYMDPLYITANDVMIVGDLYHPVTGFFRDHNRVLATTALGLHAIALSSVDDAVETHPLTSGVGCLTHGQSILANGDPILLNRDGVFTLHAPSTDPDQFIATQISGPISDFLENGFAENAILTVDPFYHEIWIRNRNDTQGVVWVYGLSSKQWYSFDGILADCFCKIDGKLAFFHGDQIGVFDKELTTDNGSIFVSSYESAYLSLSDPELPKRGLRFSIKALPGGNQMSLWVESETRRRIFPISTTVRSAPTVFDRRAALGRFHFLRVTIRDRGSARSRIYRLALYANL